MGLILLKEDLLRQVNHAHCMKVRCEYDDGDSRCEHDMCHKYEWRGYGITMKSCTNCVHAVDQFTRKSKENRVGL